jgi:ribosomal protein S18 acetylase RimI-like enzyme
LTARRRAPKIPAVQQSASDGARLVRRITACEDAIAQAAAELFALDEGQVCRQRAYPHVFDANVVRHPRLSLPRLDEQLGRLAAPLRAVGARHLQIALDAQPLPEPLGAALRARGFVRDRLLAMVLPGAPARGPAPDVEVRDVSGGGAPFGWYADTMDRMSREEPWYTPAVSREIIGSLAAKADAGALSLFVAAREGRPVGAVGLALGRGGAAGTGAIVTVGTVPEARGRGVAQTMVVALAERARTAGCDLIYLVARAGDTPKEMYRKLGFAVSFGFDVWLRPPI